MINVNDIYEESEDSFRRVFKATRGELESIYGKEMVEDSRDKCIGDLRDLPEHKGDYGTIRGPSKDGGFLVGDQNGLHVWIDAGMLDFMIEHRAKKED